MKTGERREAEGKKLKKSEKERGIEERDGEKPEIKGQRGEEGEKIKSCRRQKPCRGREITFYQDTKCKWQIKENKLYILCIDVL